MGNAKSKIIRLGPTRKDEDVLDMGEETLLQLRFPAIGLFQKCLREIERDDMECLWMKIMDFETSSWTLSKLRSLCSTTDITFHDTWPLTQLVVICSNHLISYLQYEPSTITCPLRLPDNTPDKWHEVNVDTDGSRYCIASCEAGIGPQRSVPYRIISVANVRIFKNGARYPPESCPEFVVWFHAAERKHAEHIVINGIRLSKGSAEQDFSDGSGFYLSTDYLTAQERAKGIRKRRKNSAIIIFKIKRTLLSSCKSLDLAQDQNLWRDVICLNRRGHDHSTVPEENKGWDLYDPEPKFDYMIGPMCCNPTHVNEKTDIPKQFKAQKTQVCILTDEMAKKIGDIRHMDILFHM